MKAWLKHVSWWFYEVRQFPWPWNDDMHSWTGLLGSPEESCLVCGMERIDPEWDKRDAEEEQRINDAWTEASKNAGLRLPKDGE